MSNIEHIIGILYCEIFPIWSKSLQSCQTIKL